MALSKKQKIGYGVVVALIFTGIFGFLFYGNYKIFSVISANKKPMITGAQTFYKNDDGETVSVTFGVRDEDQTSNHKWVLESGDLPTGLSFRDGTVSGTINADNSVPKNFDFVVGVQDDKNDADSVSIHWKVSPKNWPPTVTNIGDKSHRLSDGDFLVRVQATDRNAGDSLSYSLGGRYPRSLQIDPVTGEITASFVPADVGTWDVVVYVRDGVHTASDVFKLVIQDDTSTSGAGVGSSGSVSAGVSGSTVSGDPSVTVPGPGGDSLAFTLRDGFSYAARTPGWTTELKVFAHAKKGADVGVTTVAAETPKSRWDAFVLLHRDTNPDVIDMATSIGYGPDNFPPTATVHMRAVADARAARLENEKLRRLIAAAGKGPAYAIVKDASGVLVPGSGTVRIALGSPLVLNASDSTGSGLKFKWDFGDFTPPVTADKVDHTYATHGLFDLVLSVSDDQGNPPDIYRLGIEVMGDVPVAKISTLPQLVEGVAVQFDGTGSTGDTITYAWKVTSPGGDVWESTGVRPNPDDFMSIPPASPVNPKFILVLTVTDRFGRTAEDKVEFTVWPKAPVANAGSYSGVSFPAGLTSAKVTLDGSGSKGDSLIYNWRVEPDPGAGTDYTGKTVDVELTGTSGDTYEVTLTVTDPQGRTEVDKSTITIN